MISERSARSTNESAARRSSSPAIAGCDLIVETMVARTPLRWTAATTGAKSLSPENRTA
jgi:hypothetical protein